MQSCWPGSIIRLEAFALASCVARVGQGRGIPSFTDEKVGEQDGVWERQDLDCSPDGQWADQCTNSFYLTVMIYPTEHGVKSYVLLMDMYCERLTGQAGRATSCSLPCGLYDDKGVGYV